MKDLYSFHKDEADFKKYYEKVKAAYLKIFSRCGLKAIVTEASGGDFTKEFSHEFQVLSKDGEDTIIFCPSGDFSQNVEITKYKSGDKCPACGAVLEKESSIEAGNIFPLGDKFSKALGALFTTSQGERRPIVMGCYGIGISRLMGAIVEIHHDKHGIIWPKETAPFAAHLIALHKAERETEEIYQKLRVGGMEVLLDDRQDKSAGEKFAEADLIGIPLRLVISENTLKQKSVELKRRNQEKTQLIKIAQLDEKIIKQVVRAV